MLTIVSDDVGRHDFLYASCSIEMYRKQYGVTGYHANCYDKSPRPSSAGDSMILRAEMDLAIALSACPASTRNGGGPTKPLAFEVL